MGTTTTNYSLYKPGISEGGYGDLMNANFDTIDTTLDDHETRVAALEAAPGGGGGYTEGAHVTQSTNQSVPTGGSGLKIPFDTETHDTDTIHSTVTNTTRLTCVTTGVYSIGASLMYAANATGNRDAYILLNNTTFIAADNQSARATGGTTLTPQTIYPLTAGDYVELVTYQTSGGALNVEAYDAIGIAFWMQRIG
jgi:hypothetical protein